MDAWGSELGMESNMSSRLLIAGFAVVTLIGCGPNSQPPAKSGNAGTGNSAPVVESVAAREAPANRVQAVEGEAAMYTQTLQHQLDPRRVQAAPATATVIRAPEIPIPSLPWLENPDWTLRLGPPQASATAAQAAVVAPSPTAQAAAPMRDANPSGGNVNPGPVITPGQMEPIKAATLPDALETRIGQAAKDYPRDFEPQFEQQLLSFLGGKNVPQLESISNLPADDRELLSAVLDQLTNVRAGAKNANLPLAGRVRPLIDTAERLRAQVGLTIPTIALCSRVDGFGVYEPIPAPRFAPGKEYQVVVYCEVENFSSRTNIKGIWETTLTQEVVIYNSASEKVASEAQQPVIDLSRSRRHDFFVGRRVRLPANLPAGNYSIRVTIRDQQANRLAESTAPIQIGN
jgi:hypothetical protein